MHKLMAGCGLISGHESVFTPRGPLYNLWDDYDVESSWMAAPHLNSDPACSCTIVHLVRHPVKVINSFLALDFYNKETAYTAYLNSHIDLSQHANEIDRACHHYISWNKMISESLSRCNNYLLFRLEDNPQHLLQDLGLSGPNFADKRYNSRAATDSDKTIRERIAASQLELQLTQYAGELGYTL